MWSSCCASSRECARTSKNTRRSSPWDARRTAKSPSTVGPEERLTSAFESMVKSFSSSNVSNCEGGSSRRERPSDNNPYKDEIERMQRELDEPCQACMYTGVAVCTGLSLYFVKLATDDTTLPKNRRFLWVCSAGSLVAGAYRWYLG